jgi:hypothetical protein
LAAPRVFLSSTCYDLLEIRHNLRNFIQEFNYEPVMSEFGDIFYEYDAHVQDACLKEIEKCQLFVLVIGNNYGSVYHKTHPTKEVAESVTLKEFTKSISVNIPKHIFINRFVHYDYQNYRRILDNKMKEYFDSTEVADKDVVSHKQRIRKEFDAGYHFPQNSYKYIFHFLDAIHSLKINNAIFPFETVDDIKLALKKQWAGYMYEKLTDSRLERIEQAQKERLDDISSRITSIEKMLQNLFSQAHPTNQGELSFDIGRYINSFAYDNFDTVKDLLTHCLEDVMKDENYIWRCSIREPLTYEMVNQWLLNLDNLVKKFKWSKTIPLSEIFSNIEIEESRSNPDNVDYDSLLKLNGLFVSMPSEERESFVNSVKLYLDQYVVTRTNDFFVDEDDVPF